MSDLKHTPEPWIQQEHVILSSNFDTNISYSTNKDSNGRYSLAIPIEQTLANKARIVACVNACAGKPYPELWIKQAEEILEKVVSFEHPEMKLGESKIDTLIKMAAERDAYKELLTDIVKSGDTAMLVGHWERAEKLLKP
jgi:DNA-binding sugar fermentation-stimulating protein